MKDLKILTKQYDDGKFFTVEVIGPRRENGGRYEGDVMRIEHDETWLHLETDAAEGHAMINIEALPAIIRALNAIKKQRKLAAE